MQPKIVSLIPSATEIVHALGFGDCQLGRSHECDYPESVLSLSVCTAPKFAPSGNSREIDQDVRDTLRDVLSIYDVFHPVLEQLQPSHIITQSQCEVCAVNLKDVELAVGKLVSSDPQLVSLEAHSWPDVLGDIACVAEALQVESKGRELVKQLASEFQTRIQMRQIGVRDEAKLLADYGDCGKPLCCNTHLSKMPPVSMKMAKLQKATLDPTKISGRCGRLKCCLRYEYDTYTEMRRDLPPIGSDVVTNEGRARILGHEILTQQVLVQFEDNRRIMIDVSDILSVIKTNSKQANK